MRINAIRNGRMDYSAQKIRAARAIPQNTKPETVPCCDKISFKGPKEIGAGIGASVGVTGLALLSLVSGGLAAPIAFLAYATMGGAVGGAFGKITENADKEEL